MTTPAATEPERSENAAPSARPSGRGTFQSAILATASNTFLVRSVADILVRRNSIGSMF